MVQPIEFLFDYASPWAYLANEVVGEALPGSTVTFRPTYIRGLESFAAGLPYGAAKMAYLIRDFERCATRAKVPVRMPSVFPLNGIHALRGALAAMEQGQFEKYHQAMFRATWRDDIDVSKKEVVLEIAGTIGLDAQLLAQRIESPEIKNKLRSDTEAAVSRGVFGLPTFFVGDEMFWGYDRLDQVRLDAREKA